MAHESVAHPKPYAYDSKERPQVRTPGIVMASLLFDNDSKHYFVRFRYAQAVRQFFDWYEARGIRTLDRIEPVLVAAYIEQHEASAPTVKQHLAAIRMLFDWLVIGHIVAHNPVTSVRGPKHVVRRGKTAPTMTGRRRQAKSVRMLPQSMPRHRAVARQARDMNP